MKRRRRYTAEFKQQAMELVEAGRSAAEVAEEFDIELSCLYAWIRKARAAQAAQGGSDDGRAEGECSEADELRRLRRENARLRSENVILKKPPSLSGPNTPGKPTRDDPFDPSQNRREPASHHRYPRVRP